MYRFVKHMSKELFLLADKIQLLRENIGMTQSEFAKSLGLSRSGVNAWEMGLSIPSTQYIVELAKLFKVSADYLLGIDNTSTICIKGLSENQVSAVMSIIECFRNGR